MPTKLLSVIGDCHLGVARRNKWLYEKSHEAFDTIIDYIGAAPLAVAGDLWDNENPMPYDLVYVQEKIDKVTTTIIPGNHDRVLIDGTCAAFVLNHAYVHVTPHIETIGDGSIVIHYFPFTADIIDRLKDYTNSFDEFGDGRKHILISHFSLAETMYAGHISEKDPVFENYDQVIIADSHICYDHGKFHTTGATYFCTITEMHSPNSIPSCVNIMSDGSVERVTFPEFKPIVINSEVEAVDDDKLYMIISKNAVPITKKNVVVMFTGKNGEVAEDFTLNIDESVSLQGGIDRDKFFSMVYPDMSKSDLIKLRDFEAGLIDVEELVSDDEPAKKDDGSADEAILNGLAQDDDFSF